VRDTVPWRGDASRASRSGDEVEVTRPAGVLIAVARVDPVRNGQGPLAARYRDVGQLVDAGVSMISLNRISGGPG